MAAPAQFCSCPWAHGSAAARPGGGDCLLPLTRSLRAVPASSHASSCSGSWSRCPVLRCAASDSSSAAPVTPQAPALPQGLESSVEKPTPAGGAGNTKAKAALHEALQQLAEEDLETASQKYDLHKELFSEIDFARINAFSTSPFGGNPAAVVYLPYMPSPDWLQKIAAEFNLSETAYLVRRRPTRSGPLQRTEDGGGVKAVGPGQDQGRPLRGNEFDLRWFTPTTEVKLCGHATLASAHLLFTAGLLEKEYSSVVFHTQSGQLTARRVREEDSLFAELQQAGDNVSAQDHEQEQQPQGEAGSLGRRDGAGGGEVGKGNKGGGKGIGIVELGFPALPLVPLDASECQAVETALRLSPGSVLFAGRNSLHYILAEVASEAEVLEANPNIEAVAELPVLGVILTSLTHRHKAAGEGNQAQGPASEHAEQGQASSSRREELSRADFVARFFAPQAGVDEDPVTGSAFCTLGPYYAHRLGRSKLWGFQASERGGEVLVAVDESRQLVRLQGWAVLVQAGVLLNTMAPGTM